MESDEKAALSPALAQVLTTEHFTLQGARAVLASEVSSRATIYLSAVSSAVVALAFITTLSQAEEWIRGFTLVLLPVLSFMGFVTKARLVQISYTDFHYQRAINRIRHFYVDVAPESARYLLLSIHDDLSGVADSAVYDQGRRMGILTAAQMIAVVNYVVVGLLGGIIFAWLTGVNTTTLILVGIAIGLALAMFDFRRSETRWNAYVASLDVRFPTP
uniref:hypothetical protein n=1 Tax=Promineifilum sp. TaxID=2664178 RepID=UPI0035B00393